jgi:transcriptional regulator GlxA family with amidase domain
MKFAFLLYPGIEPIDIAAIGVLSMGRRVMPSLEFFCVAETLDLCTFSNGLRVAPEFTFADCPEVDAIIVPGGPGWPAAGADGAIQGFLRSRRVDTLLISTCTGAMVLAGSGVLDGHIATTKCEVRPPEVSTLTILERDYPAVTVRKALVVDEGSVVSGGGVSLCIDTVLHVLATRIGLAETNEIVRLIEYGPAWQANKSRLPTLTHESRVCPTEESL